jgi:hypothetical protein
MQQSNKPIVDENSSVATLNQKSTSEIIDSTGIVRLQLLKDVSEVLASGIHQLLQLVKEMEDNDDIRVGNKLSLKNDPRVKYFHPLQWLGTYLRNNNPNILKFPSAESISGMIKVFHESAFKSASENETPIAYKSVFFDVAATSLDLRDAFGTWSLTNSKSLTFCVHVCVYGYVCLYIHDFACFESIASCLHYSLSCVFASFSFFLFVLFLFLFLFFV